MLVLECRMCVLFGEEIKICLACSLLGIVKTKSVRLGLADFEEAALPVLEINMVQCIVHERVEQVAFIRQRCLRLFAPGDVAIDANGV